MSDNPQPQRDYFRMLSPVTLAFMGDAVYEILAREHLLLEGNLQAEKLHRKKVQLVRAAAQAQAVPKILPLLTQEEQDVLRRGRNANTAHIPKNSSVLDYRHATGLEALFGFLYLCGESARIRELFGLIVGKKSVQTEGIRDMPSGNNLLEEKDLQTTERECSNGTRRLP